MEEDARVEKAHRAEMECQLQQIESSRDQMLALNAEKQQLNETILCKQEQITQLSSEVEELRMQTASLH